MTIAGFEPLDVLQSIWMVLKQIEEGRCEIENQYARVVSEAGNSPALSAAAKVYELREFFEWGGSAPSTTRACGSAKPTPGLTPKENSPWPAQRSRILNRASAARSSRV
jgi:hypothetical protein